MPGLRSLLELPSVYRGLLRILGGQARSKYLDDYVKPRHGDRILDIGCGPGDILEHLPKVDYLGVDLSPAYVEAAQRRFGERGRFVCQDVADLSAKDAEPFDLVLANGLLHHLDDGRVRHLLQVAARRLKSGGRLVTLDGCWVPGQSRIARMLLKMDRGKFIRDASGYTGLAKEVFANVTSHVRHDLLRLPYTLHIMVCRKSEGQAEKPS